MGDIITEYPQFFTATNLECPPDRTGRENVAAAR